MRRDLNQQRLPSFWFFQLELPLMQALDFVLYQHQQPSHLVLALMKTFFERWVALLFFLF
jgi:hypothetical protein